MLKKIAIAFMLIHAILHGIGFASGWMPGLFPSTSLDVFKESGLYWLMASLLLLAALVLVLKERAVWWIPAAAALLLSQVLIIQNWPDAKWGSIPNCILLLMITAGCGSWSFERKWKKEVLGYFRSEPPGPPVLLTEEDLAPLPLPVQRYLRYTRALGKPKVRNIRIVFEGKMRNRRQDWFPFRSEQYNFLEAPARLFFMKGKIKGLTIPGYHRYVRGHAAMEIRLFGLIPVARHQGGLMNRSETVTLLNDICLMAPGALTGSSFRWESVDELQARVYYKTAGMEVSALLTFNGTGQLVDFYTEDRGDTGDMKIHPFSTPCGHYRDFNGYTLQSEGDAVWHYQEGPFVYGHFILKEVHYNLERPCR